MTQKIVITGGSGFLGSYLSQTLSNQGFEVCIISRKQRKSPLPNVEFLTYEFLDSAIDGAKAVINLAGFNLFDSRWKDSVKKEIIDSRIKTTKAVVGSINKSKQKPEVLISASAVGFYGNRGNQELTENSQKGADFLADVCQAWEEAAQKAESIRVVIPRIGIILEKDGGALGKMLTPFQFFVGGPLGDGNQYFPWVHMSDVVNSIVESISNVNFKGVYNCVAPQQVTMNEFASVLGTVLSRPALFKVPKFVLSLVLGESSEALVASQKVSPNNLQEWKYQFRFDDLKAALTDILD